MEVVPIEDDIKAACKQMPRSCGWSKDLGLAFYLRNLLYTTFRPTKKRNNVRSPKKYSVALQSRAERMREFNEKLLAVNGEYSPAKKRPIVRKTACSKLAFIYREMCFMRAR